MNDFSELEAELKKLRPRAASPELTARIERGLAEVSGRTATAGVLPKARSFRVNWSGLGLGLAAAATLLLLARVDVEQTPGKRPTVVAMTPVPFAQPVPVKDAFVPAGLTEVVYDTRDEGLHFPESGDQPVRRVRSRKRETLKWNNPQTRTSLRVSYPSEEVTLIPVEGQ
ncbi:MAG TPA: hypothetical protein VGW39_14710 [Chthoniobacterales bacterium]|nr:hypothetical protein [Chthoniobacterales bacterium]